MIKGRINFFSEGIGFVLEFKKERRKWIRDVVRLYNKQIGDLDFVFVSDAYLLEMNRSVLNHDYFTDIITFDTTVFNIISGELYISIDRIIEHANEFNSSFTNELDRVMIHGVLHLCGFNDKATDEIRIMRDAEQIALSKRMFHVEQFD